MLLTESTIFQLCSAACLALFVYLVYRFKTPLDEKPPVSAEEKLVIKVTNAIGIGAVVVASLLIGGGLILQDIQQANAVAFPKQNAT